MFTTSNTSDNALTRLQLPSAKSGHSLQIPTQGSQRGSQDHQLQEKTIQDKLNCDSYKSNFIKLFDKDGDILLSYIQLMQDHKLNVRSFSTSDMSSTEPNDNLNNFAHKKCQSEMNLSNMNPVHLVNHPSASECISYSCSTLAICGDTVHSSSQLPSPQARHESNYFELQSDIDLIRLFNKKARQQFINTRFAEFFRVANLSSWEQREMKNNYRIDITPLDDFRILSKIQNSTGFCEMSINITKCVERSGSTWNDKSDLILNWLQNIEPYTKPDQSEI